MSIDEQKMNEVQQPALKQAPVSGSRRHKWVQKDDSYVCEHCGVRKKNIWMGWGKNGKAALYFLENGDRTSYRPDCR
jgi:hypothetical protein